jgi:hypothetical protein
MVIQINKYQERKHHVKLHMSTYPQDSVMTSFREKGMLNAEHNFLKNWCKKVTISKHEAMW